ncbi:CpsD/CapB family tyrosine-protein kinase [Roseivivax isoporae]|uniref:CobQ/CobB/MinD/ParA nucleotide binding domain-containing protein n=1 Tax=Roseivivax isoporae LMG 25204 TaxID=1449351 RepID=X7F6S5_9RHOB|nr:CpsD/CapB family tyrosine-protein kinase [Roseivivax isoporae]ETX27784.1 hypothetical protein RISW2_11325 [Roseivivax isoporae LMG 25204]
MAAGPRFRRRKGRAAPAEDDLRPVPPLASREERLARRAEDMSATESRSAAAEEARARDGQAAEAERARHAAEAEAETERLRIERDAERARIARELAEAREAERARAAEAERPLLLRAAEPAREPAPAPEAPPSVPGDGSAAAWERLARFSVDERELDRHRVVTASRHDPAHVAFDVLRTRLLQALAERGWSRVAVTSPTQGCGKTFTAANLGISLARQENARTVVLDLDLRRPTLHKVFGLREVGSMGDVLRGRTPPEAHLRRLGPNTFHAGGCIAFGFNDAPETYAAELLQDRRSRAALDLLEARFAPDVVLIDLPPALASDDVLALRPAFDAVLLVVGGGLTTQAEIREVQKRLGEDTPLLGVVLNRAEGVNTRKYAY